MTPIEFWWLHPEPPPREGAMDPDWVEEMAKRYDRK